MTRRIAVALFTLFLFAACNDNRSDRQLAEKARRIFGPLPPAATDPIKDTADRIALGKALYFDTRLSVNGKQSCNSCHPVDGQGVGADGQMTSAGALGHRGTRNTPTVFNAAMLRSQFWDGRAADLAAQAKGPITNPIEMAMPSEDEAVRRIAGVTGYPAMFARAFPGEPEPVTFENIARAIAAYERTLITRDRFDQFQNGNLAALTAEEKKGLRLFIETGCISCHRGPAVGGEIFQKVGLMHDYPNRGDLGRFNVTGRAGDKFVFRVPALRNVGLTRPYFHDGKIQSLYQAVDTMAYLQLDKRLPPADVIAIVKFLQSLSDQSRAGLNQT